MNTNHVPKTHLVPSKKGHSIMPLIYDLLLIVQCLQGLPEDLPTMPSMQLISCKSVLIEIPLSTFNRYLRPKVGPLISKSFLPFHALCESSTDKFNRLNCWESVKRRQVYSCDWFKRIFSGSDKHGKAENYYFF